MTYRLQGTDEEPFFVGDVSLERSLHGTLTRDHRNRGTSTNLQHVDRLAGDMAQKFILIVKVASKHFG